MFTDDVSRLSYLHSIVKVLPDLPGVYQYFDESGVIIYIGKAKSLIKRVSNYFFGSNLTSKTRVLVSKIFDIKHIVVDSEEDAFLLENNLIKKHKPRYNILLKDDKTYPWIVIKNEPFPRVELTRNLIRNGSLYFGPYTSSFQIKTLLELIHQLYPLRSCNLNLSDDKISKSNYKVCLKFHIHNCSGPCVSSVSHEEYQQFISEIKNILNGNFSLLIRHYNDLMMNYAENLEFEKANLIKQKLSILTNYQSKSMVSNVSCLNTDVISYFDDEETKICYINYLKISDGVLLQSYSFSIKRVLDESIPEIMSLAIFEIKSKFKVLSREIIVSVLPDVALENIKFIIPQLGDKKKLLELSEKNARLYRLELLKHEAVKNGQSSEERLLSSIKNILNLKVLPRHIECFDNSNIQGKHAVAACVVYKDCKPSKSDYRLFNIKTVEGPDDYASMYEVVYRRYLRLKNENQAMPDLIVADGGVGQMQVMSDAISSLSLSIPIVGLAKDSHHSTRDILYGFPPKVVNVGKNDSIFRFFTKMQDEVHRFAISFHKEKRSKYMLDSSLTHVNGIGEKTINLLLKTFKSVDNIRSASYEDLSNLIGKSKASILISFFQSNEDSKK